MYLPWIRSKLLYLERTQPLGSSARRLLTNIFRITTESKGRLGPNIPLYIIWSEKGSFDFQNEIALLIFPI